MVLGFLLMKYREQVGDMLGEPAWATKVGGIYTVVIAFGIFVFFWGVATMTGTTDVLFSPIVTLFGAWARNSAPEGF